MIKKRRLFLAVTICLVVLMFFMSTLAEDEWLCSECGHTNHGNFCTNCGTPKPKTVTCSQCGESFPLEEHYRFCPICGNKLNDFPVISFTYEGRGFDSPEEAVLFYMEGLRELNLNKMLGAYAWESQAQALDFDAMIELNRGYVIQMYPSFPSNNDFLISINLEQKRASEISFIKNGIYAFITKNTPISDPSKAYGLQTIKEARPINKLSELFDISKLDLFKSISNVRVFTPEVAIREGFLKGKFR